MGTAISSESKEKIQTLLTLLVLCLIRFLLNIDLQYTLQIAVLP